MQNYYKEMQNVSLLKWWGAFYMCVSKNPLFYDLTMAVRYSELKIAAVNHYPFILEYFKLFICKLFIILNK